MAEPKLSEADLIGTPTWPQSTGEGTNLKFVPPACPQSE